MVVLWSACVVRLCRCCSGSRALLGAELPLRASASEGGKTAIKTTTRAHASAPRAPARSGHTPGHARAALAPGGRLPTAPGAHFWCVRGHHLASQKAICLKRHGLIFFETNARGFKEEFGALFPVRLVSIPPRFAVITNSKVGDRPLNHFWVYT